MIGGSVVGIKVGWWWVKKFLKAQANITANIKAKYKKSLTAD